MLYLRTVVIKEVLRVEGQTGKVPCLLYEDGVGDCKSNTRAALRKKVCENLTHLQSAKW
jgi:hypothetical protein